MLEFLNNIAYVIVNDIFIGYAFYTILFLLASIFVRGNESIQMLDGAANTVVAFCGLLYFVVGWIIPFCLYTFSPEGLTNYRFWWVPWLQGLFWVLLSQLLWIKRLRKVKILRVIIAFFLIFSFERLVILITSLHRDYVPSGWSNTWYGMGVGEIIAGMIFKAGIVVIIAWLYLMANAKFKMMKSKR